MRERSVLDDIYNYLGSYVIYPNEHARVSHAAWILGSYFLEFEDIPVFDNFPIIAFLSPDEDSGKSRALDVTETLAYNAISGGSYTAPSLCRDINKRHPEMLTIILDELDETLSPGRDNSDYIRLLNNGYQRGKYIVRASLTDDTNVKTPAYCPKAIAGLTTTKLKKTTRSRMIIVRMRPLRDGEHVERHLDKTRGAELVERIKQWRTAAVEELKTVDEDSLSMLTKRAAQIWHPLLAIAKISGGDWFDRTSEAAEYFVNKQKPEDTLGRKILIELYRTYLSGKYPKGIHSETFASGLYLRGFSHEIDKFKVAYYLGANGYGIPTGQIKLKHEDKYENKNGYIWDDCIPFFADYLPEDMRTEIAKEVGMVEVSRDNAEKVSLRPSW